MKGYFNKEHKWVNINTASNTPIADLSNSYDSNNVEGALQEAAAKDLLLQNKSDEHTKKIQELDESVEWLKANGGGGGGTGSGGSVLPNLTSTLKETTIVVPKGKEIILPIFFTSPNIGNGTLIVIVNGVQKDAITIKQGSLEVNIGALTELRNTLKVYVKDRAGLLSNELSWTVVNGGIGLTLDFDYMSDYTTDHDILMRYYIDTEESSPHLQVTVDGKTSTVSCNIGYNEFYFNNMAPGIHAVEVKAISGNFISETYTFNLVVINSETLYISTTFNSGEEIMYGLPISIPYRTSYKDDTPITVNMYLNNELQKTLTAKRGSYAWTLGAINVGDYTYKIEAKLRDKTSSVEGSFKVVQGDYTPITINTAGLKYRLDPVGRSNEDTDKESFVYDNGREQITTTIYNSNFASNGWIDNSLKLDGGSYGIIDYSPWEDNVINGSTIEIVFTSTDIGKPDAKVIEYKDKKTNKGFYVGLEQAYMSSTAKQNLVSIYPGEKTTVSFVVDRKNKFCKTYVNGICTRAFMLSDSGSGTSAIYESLDFADGKIYINANNNEKEQGVVLIHDIRIYARTLSDDEIIKNVIALETDMAKQKTMYDFMFDNNTLPVMRMTGDASDMSDVNKKVMRIQYSSPNTEKYGQPFDLPYCKVYFQGTSSLTYVRKNYTIELYDDYMADYYYCPYPNGVEDRLFCLKADYMESSHARNVGITRLINEYFYDSKNPAQLKNPKVTNSIQGFPMLLYMNDEFLGVYNFNVDRYSAKSFGYTDEDTTLVYEISANSDTTAGAFFKYEKESYHNNLKYYAKSINANNSFNTAGIASEYIPVNAGDSITFNPGWNTSNIELLTYYDTDNQRRGQIAKGKTFTIPTEIKYVRLNMWDTLSSIPSTVNINGVDYTLVKCPLASDIDTIFNGKSGTALSELDYYRQDFMCLYPPTRVAGNDNYAEVIKLVEWVDNASEEEFVGNLEQHFNKEYLIKYYIFANLFGAVDSLGKNMKLASWDGGNVWYLQMYDCDTTCGLDNTGFDKFASDIEMGDSNVYNTTSSKLWAKVGLYLLNEVKTVYADMRQKGLRYENIIDCIVTNQIDKIPATFYNKDTQTKYLDFGSTYLYAVHGNDKQHMSLWLKDRLLYLDTLWDYDASTIDYVTVRSSKLGNIYMNIETFKNMYLKVKWRNDATGASTQKLRVSKTGPTRFSFKSVTETDQEILIYGGQYIKSLGDLTNLSPTTISLNEATKINNLTCHSDKLINVEVSACTNLQKIDLSDCTNLGTGTGTSTVLDVTNCSELSYINIKGTTLQGISLNARGSNVEEIWYPSSIEEITVNNCPHLKILGLEYGHNCKSLRIINCPNIKAFGELQFNSNYNRNKYDNSYYLAGLQSFELNNSCQNWTRVDLAHSKNLNKIVLKNLTNIESVRVGCNYMTQELTPRSTIEYEACTQQVSVESENCPKLESFYVTCLGRKSFAMEETYGYYNEVYSVDRPEPFNRTDRPTYYNWRDAFIVDKLDLTKIPTLKNVYLYSIVQIKNLVLPQSVDTLIADVLIDIKDAESKSGYDSYIRGNTTGYGFHRDGGFSRFQGGAGSNNLIDNIYCGDIKDSVEERYTWDLEGLTFNEFFINNLNTKEVATNNVRHLDYNANYDLSLDYQIKIKNFDYKPHKLVNDFSVWSYKSIQGKMDTSELEATTLIGLFARFTDNMILTFKLEDIDTSKVINYKNILYYTKTSQLTWKLYEKIFPYFDEESIINSRGIQLKEQENFETDGITLYNSTVSGLYVNTSESWITDSNIKYIKEINLPMNISVSNAFRNNPYLTKVGNIILGSNNVTNAYFGGISNIFARCSNLESVGEITFYSVVPVINNQQSYSFTSAFQNCPKLKTVGKIHIIGQEYKTASLTNMFSGDSSLESIDVSEFECNYLSYTFQGCSKLKTIKLPKLSSCTYFSNAFQSCTNLQILDFTETELSNNTKATEFFAFCMECTSLEELIGFSFPTSVTTIERAFQGCLKLRTYTDISQLTLLNSANAAYNKCSSLQLPSEIVFPKTSKALNTREYLKDCKITGEITITSGDSGDVGINFDSLLNNTNFSKVTLNINTKLTGSGYMVGSMSNLNTLILNWKDPSYSQHLNNSAYWSANTGNITTLHGWCIGIMNSGWMYVYPDALTEVTWVGVAKGNVNLREAFANNSNSSTNTDQNLKQECVLDLIENHLSDEGGTLTLGSSKAYTLWDSWGYIDKLTAKNWSVVY